MIPLFPNFPLISVFALKQALKQFSIFLSFEILTSLKVETTTGNPGLVKLLETHFISKMKLFFLNRFYDFSPPPLSYSPNPENCKNEPLKWSKQIIYNKITI